MNMYSKMGEIKVYMYKCWNQWVTSKKHAKQSIIYKICGAGVDIYRGVRREAGHTHTPTGKPERANSSHLPRTKPTHVGFVLL